MNQTVHLRNPHQQKSLSCYSTHPSQNKLYSTETESVGHTTIDGSVLNYMACEQAVNNGSGIFIGEYFVGITENTNAFNHMPLLHY
ncbi:hypothetical protein ACMA1I_22590 [Pontibacter sp. 13R65]|uniref:hypothetical protein n=1 Tax=Pontibacter sp. 13R65 TaxID=3127458 RepID=UPI00301CE73F